MMYTKLKLPYKNSFVDTSIPARNVRYILDGMCIAGLEDEREAILNALRNPIGCTALRDCIHKNDRVVLIVTDNTRPCPDNRIVPVILEELEEKVPRKNITILVALGLHQPLSFEELTDKLGKDIVENYNVVNHNPDQTVYLGRTSRGTPVEVNTRLAEADFRISTGFIESHFFAGFSGGRKSIAPGVSSSRSIRKNHSYQMIEHPCARAGILEGNPVHEDMVEQARMAKLDFIVNVLLNRNQEITHVMAGDPVLAHERGCQLERDIVQVKVERKVDITITTNGGAPLDLDFYQTCKGIDTASQITRDGGIIIIASSCDRGVGPKEFLALHSSSNSPEEVLQKIRRSKNEGVYWQNQILARAQLNHDIYLLSTLDDITVKQMMVTPIRTIQEGLEKAFQTLGADSQIAVIPRGPLILPLVETGSHP